MGASFIWFYFFLTLTLAMVLLVPREEILRLLPFGLVGGFGVAVIMQYIAINIFKFWKFNVALLSIANIPVGVLFAWIPPVIIFAYFLDRVGTGLGQTIYIVFFAVGTTIVEYSFVLTRAREYLKWNVYLTFLLALAIHLGLVYYLRNKEKIFG